MNTVYSVVGLGKLGASMVAALAKQGHQVIGLDINQQAVEAINQGQSPVQETALAETLAAYQVSIQATQSYQEAILGSQVTFIVVPTPSDEQGAFSLRYAAQAFSSIGRVLAQKKDYHLVVLTSTVLPGATRYGLLPLLENQAGKVAGRDFGLCYSPAFIALGSVIRDFLNPDFTLIGELDQRSGDLLEICYENILQRRAPCQRMSLENAELAKIALNTFVTTKITFANMLADLCARLPGGDVDVVSDALGLDARIGRKYLTGSLGYGGPCFPRDNLALSFMAQALGTKADLAETTHLVNQQLMDNVIANLCHTLNPETKIAILGLAYKPDSNVIEASPGVHLATAFSQAGMRVRAYDPLANAVAKAELDDKIEIMDSLTASLSQAEVVLITTPDPAFKNLTAADFPCRSTPIKVIDFWRILDKSLSKQAHIHYVPYGRSVNELENRARLQKIWEPLGSQSSTKI